MGLDRISGRASVRVFDSAVEKAFGDTKKILWLEVLAGEKAYNQTGEWQPQATLDSITKYRVAIKGPFDNTDRRGDTIFEV